MFVHSSSQYSETAHRLAWASLSRLLDLSKKTLQEWLHFQLGQVILQELSVVRCTIELSESVTVISFFNFSSIGAHADISRFVVYVLYFTHGVKYVSIIYYREYCWFGVTVMLFFVLMVILKRFI